MELLEILKREDGCLSFGRILALIIFLLWFSITVAMFIMGKTFPEYSNLTYAMLVSLFGVVCGKWLDIKK